MFQRIMAVPLALMLGAAHAHIVHPLPAFHGVALTDGIQATVRCSQHFRATVSGSQPYLEKQIAMHVKHGILHAHFTGERRLNDQDHTVLIEIPPGQPLTQVTLTHGANLRLPACALSPEQLRVQLHNHVILAASGHTQALNLIASSNSTFTSPHGAPFHAKHANIQLSDSRAWLCHVQRIQGQLQRAGELYSTETPQLLTQGGARYRCQPRHWG